MKDTASRRSLSSPLLKRWLGRGTGELDSWLAAMNGIALLFILSAVGSMAQGNADPPPVRPDTSPEELPPSMFMELPAPMEDSSQPAPTQATLPVPVDSPPDSAPQEEEVIETVESVWRDQPEMIEPAEVVEPVRRPTPPAAVPTPPAAKPATPPRRSRPVAGNALPGSGSSTSASSSGNTGTAARGSSGMGRGTTPQPPYPAFARRDRLQGTVVVGISVVDGKVSAVNVVRSSGSGALDSYAVGHVKKRWKWPAGTNKSYTQPFRFILQ